MIQVFYLVYGLTSGGIEKYSVMLNKYIQKDIFKFDFIVKYNKKDFFDNDLYLNKGYKIPIVECADNSIKGRIIYLKRLISIIKKGYDIAYFNLNSPSAVFKYPLVCKLFGINNIIIHSHSSYIDEVSIITKIINFFGRKLINKIASCRFACSDKAAEWMFGKKVAENKLYEQIQNGIEAEKYIFNKEIRNKKRKQLGLSNDDFVIGHVGRFTPAKNHDFIIDIFIEVLKIKKNSKLLLIGIGNLQEKIITKAKENGIFDKIMFLGERIDVNEIMQVMDVFLLPSYYEGLPIAGIEAQASGLKCIFSTNISKEVEITKNAEFISLQKDANFWSQEILKYINYNRSNQEKNIKNAGFDICDTVKYIEKLLLNMVENR